MLNKNHLVRKSIKQDIFKRLKKPKLQDISFKTPSTDEETIQLIEMCESLAMISYVALPGYLEQRKLAPSRDLDYKICLLRRNIYQGHAIKDACLMQLIDSGHAKPLAYMQGHHHKLFLKIELNKRNYVVRTRKPFIESRGLVEIPFESSPKLTDGYEAYLNSDQFGFDSYKIRHMYIRWHDAYKKMMRKVQVNNEIYEQILPMVKAGQIKLISEND